MTQTTTRRALLRGASCIPAIVALSPIANAAPAASTVDPIFAVIERHRALNIAFSAILGEMNRLEDVLPSDKRTWSHSITKSHPPADCADDPLWIATELEVSRIGTEICRASVALAGTKPGSSLGLSALLTYILELEDGGDGFLTDWFTGDFDPDDGKPLYCDTTKSLLETLRDAAADLAKAA